MTESTVPPPAPSSPAVEPVASGPTNPPPSSGAAPRSRRTRLIVAIVIAAVLLIALSIVAYELLAPGPGSVHVQSIDVWTTDDVCGLGTTPIGYHGYNATVKSSVSVELQVPNFNMSKCVVHAVSTNSSGFSLSDLDLPWVIPANGSSTTHLTIHSPGSAFSGNINLIFG